MTMMEESDPKCEHLTTNFRGMALIYATEEGHHACVKQLVETGADVNVTDEHDETALMKAVKVKCKRCFQLLLESGADVNTRNDNGKTALLFAVKNNQPRFVELLIQAGADVNVSDNEDNTSLMCAILSDNFTCLDLLFQVGAEIKSADVGVYGNSALFAATKHNQAALARMLTKAGTDVNIVNEDGDSALIIAARNGSTECIEVLLEARADVNTVNKCEDSALITAAENGFTECIAVLIKAGADVNTVNEDGTSALMMASRNGSVDCVKLLIAEGADVNIRQTTYGHSALYYATRMGHDKCAVTLLKAGSYVNISNEYTFCDCSKTSKAKRDILMYAAGQGSTPDGSVANKIRPLKDISSHLSDLEPKEICLMSLCRAAIRNRLLELDPHENLFVRIHPLGVPSRLAKYLLYDVSTDENDWNSEDDFSTNEVFCICDLRVDVYFDQKLFRRAKEKFKLKPRKSP